MDWKAGGGKLCFFLYGRCCQMCHRYSCCRDRADFVAVLGGDDVGFGAFHLSGGPLKFFFDCSLFHSSES